VSFSLGSWSAQRSIAAQLAANDARLDALQATVTSGIKHSPGPTITEASATDGSPSHAASAAGPIQNNLVEEIKRQLQSEMGLLPVQLLRERRESFVELNAIDNFGKTSYGTAGYLGNGYFITVKHGVIALDDMDDGEEPRKIVSVTIRYRNRDVNAHVVDAGDANVEVHRGDWAVILVREDIDLPPLNVDMSYGFDFAEPIFRLGNDYSKGIILGTGYVGQRMTNGLVTCLTDGHPGVSGGGVLNQRGDLVGIPIGRMQGDFRFSFILPVRREMFRKVPVLSARGVVAD
jgi:hypothetical protein